LVRCANCGLLFRYPQPVSAELQALYVASWTAPVSNQAKTGSIDSDLAAQYVWHLTEAVGRTGIAGSRLLDFGAGNGTVSVALRNAGASVWAVEPYGYEHVRRQGIPVFRQFDDLPASAEFDGIVLMNVIEHVEEPWDLLRRLHSRLAIGGWLFMATPNAAGLNARVFGSSWREVRNKVHLHVFTQCSLDVLLSNCGFPVSRELRWRVRYGHGPVRNLVGGCLRRLRLDGELRCLAFKRVGGQIDPGSTL
jgi:SAM-dependent methyltransferase